MERRVLLWSGSSGSFSTMAMFTARLVRYGKGCPGSMARGVSSGGYHSPAAQAERRPSASPSVASRTPRTPQILAPAAGRECGGTRASWIRGWQRPLPAGASARPRASRRTRPGSWR
eukprot:7347055-Pyramimonas_sp.AAC.1